MRGRTPDTGRRRGCLPLKRQGCATRCRLVLALAAFCSLAPLPGGASAEELPENQKTRQKYSNHGRFVLIFSETDRIVIDKRSHFYEVVQGDAVVLRREERFLQPLNVRDLERDPILRREFYSRGPVLFTLTNAVTNGDVVALVHQMAKTNALIRIVQVVDRKMALQAVWEDELPFLAEDYGLGMEPFAIGESGQMAGLGEPGELVVYGPDGSVRRSVAVSGVFDTERRPRITIVDEKKNYHLSAGTLELIRAEERRTAAAMQEFIRERDRRLAGKALAVAALDYANINGLFFLPDGTLNVLVGSRTIVGIDLDTGASKAHDVLAAVRNEEMPWMELIYQVLCKGWDLYLLTDYRLVHANMAEGFRKLSETPVQRHAHTVNQWTVLGGVGAEGARRRFIDITSNGKRIVELN